MERNKSQFSRLMELDRQIRAGKYPNCLTFSKAWEVSQKTIQRDIDYLKFQLDAPLAYNRVEKGFYYTDLNWFLPSVSLSEGELFALLVAGKGFMGFIPEMQAALEVSGSKSAKQLEGNLKRNMSAMYAVCRPFDAATGVRILMMDENEKLGFDFYARAPVTRVGLGSDGVAPDKRTEKNRKLLLEPVLRDSLARGEHLLAVCDSVSMKDFERQLWQAGWSFKTLAFKRSCNVVELVPPRPSNRLPPVLMQLRRLSRASSPSAPGLAP